MTYAGKVRGVIAWGRRSFTSDVSPLKTEEDRRGSAPPDVHITVEYLLARQ